VTRRSANALQEQDQCGRAVPDVFAAHRRLRVEIDVRAIERRQRLVVEAIGVEPLALEVAPRR